MFTDKSDIQQHKEVTIGSDKLLYTTKDNKYIITYISDYDNSLDTYLENLFIQIFPFYSSGRLKLSTFCGDNSEYICKNVKINEHKPGKIIITEWNNKRTPDILESIQAVYGITRLSIGKSYHALSYFENTINSKTFYIAIESTICEPYKLQYYVGKTFDELEQILKIRYCCESFKISNDCEKSWIDIAYSGGTKNLQKKRKSSKSKKFSRRKTKQRLKLKTKHNKRNKHNTKT
jgi:hypothetical protein